MSSDHNTITYLEPSRSSADLMAGSACGHFDEDIFGDELMTPFIALVRDLYF